MALTVKIENKGKEAFITLAGQLDSAAAPSFRDAVDQVFAQPEKPEKVIIVMNDLEYMASAGLRCLVFAKQKGGSTVPIVLSGVTEEVLETIEMTGFHHSVEIVENYVSSA